jgi:hypothetical protein
VSPENEDYWLLAVGGALLIIAVIAIALVIHKWVG